MLPTNVLRYGREDPLPEQVLLRAGPLSMVYHAGDLRYAKLGDREILRRVYVAVRDRNWGTVPAALSDLEMAIGDDAFRIRYRAENVDGEIDFAWVGTIEGDAQGTVTFEMDGTARSTFQRNRIGFCVLHPMACAGQPCQVVHTDGTVTHGWFPQRIAPHQPFQDVRAISHRVAPGMRAEVRLEGDVFEMEDQRNWTDASFKTYSTPLDLPFPVRVEAGTRIAQSITLRLSGQVPRVPARPRRERLALTIGTGPGTPMPRLGVSVAGHGEPLSASELARLAALHLSHLRVDLHLDRAGWEAALRQVVAEAGALDAPLEVALYLSDAAREELRSLVEALQEIRLPVCTWLVFHEPGRFSGSRWVALARQYLAGYEPRAMIGGGTDHYFTQLNRARPDTAGLDLISYSLNPQVHATDNTSLVEALETQAVTVDNARRFADGRPLAIGPITLKPRHNPSATGPAVSAEALIAAGRLPPQVDVRQMSLFGAAWTLGSLKYVCEGGVYSVTYYETTGWRGVMETARGAPLPEAFSSMPGTVYPLYHVLADVALFADGRVLPVVSSDPLRAVGLALVKGERRRLLVANLRPKVQQVEIRGLTGCVWVHVLDETNAEQAMRDPEAFRAGSGEARATADGALVLALLPYAVARVDGTPL